MTKDDYVFIAYSNRDYNFVNALVTDLQRGGIHVWRDIDQIDPGANWHIALKKGIQNASAIILVLSNNFSFSQWLLHEVDQFILENNKIVLVVIDDAGIEYMPKKLRNFLFVDFRGDYNAGLKKLIQEFSDIKLPSGVVEQTVSRSKGYVFLSYCDEDSFFLIDLKLFLKGNGYAFWDYEESDRDYHTQLFIELEDVIKQAAATLCILSPDWKRSKWTVKEYLFSEEVGTPVFLLKIKELGPTLVIAGIPYIDFIRHKDSGFERLQRELTRKGL